MAMKNFKNNYPNLVKEWHLTKNGSNKPEYFSHGSKARIWWQCSKNHEWEATIVNRTKGETGCPFCAGKRVWSLPTENDNLNLISYILENKMLTQGQIAEKIGTSVTTVSRWKYGAPIPEEQKKMLLKIAKLQASDLQDPAFSLLIKNEQEEKDWIEYMAVHLKRVGIYVANKKGKYDLGEVSEVKKMIVALNDIGVTINAERTYPPIIEYPDMDEQEVAYSHDHIANEVEISSPTIGNKVLKPFTHFDYITELMIQNYADLRKFFKQNIWSKKLESDSNISQKKLKNFAVKIALIHIPIKDLVSAGAEEYSIKKFKDELEDEVTKQIHNFCRDLREIGEPINSNYFDYIDLHPTSLKNIENNSLLGDSVIDIAKHLSLGERTILEGIEINKQLLQIILKKINEIENKPKKDT